jgi:hypothetical protein
MEDGEEPLLLTELKPSSLHQFDWKLSCETSSVSSPQVTFFFFLAVLGLRQGVGIEHRSRVSCHQGRTDKTTTSGQNHKRETVSNKSLSCLLAILTLFLKPLLLINVYTLSLTNLEIRTKQYLLGSQGVGEKGGGGGRGD